jgi:hypothetical protein
MTNLLGQALIILAVNISTNTGTFEAQKLYTAHITHPSNPTNIIRTEVVQQGTGKMITAPAEIKTEYRLGTKKRNFVPVKKLFSTEYVPGPVSTQYIFSVYTTTPLTNAPPAPKWKRVK